MKFGEETCAVCAAKTTQMGLDFVQLWRDVFACPIHTRRDLLQAYPVQARLRTAERDYYRETMRTPGALVWSSRKLAELRSFEPGEPMLSTPWRMPIIMIPADAAPEVSAVDDVVATLLIELFGGKYRSEGDLRDLILRVERLRCST